MRSPAQRTFALKLYRIIRTLHRSLPVELRAVGDTYARDEFKRHKTAEQKHLIGFFEQWVAYVNELHVMTNALHGRPAPAPPAATPTATAATGSSLVAGSALLASMGKEQTETFEKLKRTVFESLASGALSADSPPGAFATTVSSASTTGAIVEADTTNSTTAASSDRTTPH